MRFIRAFSSKIYTRTGDNGTSFIRSGRLPKYAPIFRVLGDTDELSSVLSVAREYVKVDEISSTLTDIQHRLQDINSLISTPSAADNKIAQICQLLHEKTEKLEQEIDTMTGGLAPLRNFIIPSGGPAAAHLHFSRAICRRTERSLCEYLDTDRSVAIGEAEAYLNRLSDYLFTAARYCAKLDGYTETTYSSRKPK